MSDDKNTEDKGRADGLDCPAAQPLCLCGIRGCPNEKVHAVGMSGRSMKRRRWRR